MAMPKIVWSKPGDLLAELPANPALIKELYENRIISREQLYELGEKMPYERTVVREQKPVSFQPSPPSQEMAQRKKPSVPNQMAMSDLRWGNKVAWSSSALLERQLSLATYSCEVAMVFEAVHSIVVRALGRTITLDELKFSGNFGTPIEGNKQKISIMLEEPVPLRVMLVRELVNFKLNWSADVGACENTPLMVQDRLIDLKRASGDIVLAPVAIIGSRSEVEQLRELPSVEKERKLRKVKL